MLVLWLRVDDTNGGGQGDLALLGLAIPLQVSVFGQVLQCVRNATLHRFRNCPISGLPSVQHGGTLIRASNRCGDDLPIPAIQLLPESGVDQCDGGNLGDGT